MTMADAVPCHFCQYPTPPIEGDALAVWVACPRCGARGPAVIKTRADHQAQARAAWNSPMDRLGHLGIALVPGGMPAATVSVAERLKLVAQGIYRGSFGAPTSMVLILREAKRATVSPHNMSEGDILATINAIRDSTSIRAGIDIPNSTPR